MLTILTEYYRPLSDEEKAFLTNPDTVFEGFKDVTVGHPLIIDIDCGAKLTNPEYNDRSYLAIKTKDGKWYLTSSRYIITRFPDLGWNTRARVARIKSKTTGREYLNIFDTAKDRRD